MTRNGLVTCPLALAAAFLFSGWTAHADPAADSPGVGKKVENVRLADADGKAFALHDLKDRKAVAVVFLSFDCPVSRSYAAPLADLAKAYEDRGVAFVAVCPTDDEPAVLAKLAREFRIPFPVLRDDRLTAADAFGARTVPEAFVLDGGFVLRFRGRIDDAWAARLKKNPKPTHDDLHDALDAVLAGKAVAEPVTEPVGCPIARKKAAKEPTTRVTFHRDVLPILQNRCQSCHRPGEIGPFSLMTYQQAVSWASDVKDYTQSRKMPPWKPSDGKEFIGERKLTDKEIATLAEWADGGTPEGDPKDAPPEKKFTDGWQLGKPDLILSPDDDFTVGATGGDLFRNFVLPTGLSEDRFIKAFELRAGNPRVIHHTLHFLDTQGRGRRLEKAEMDRPKGDNEKDHGPGYTFRMGPGFLPPSGDLGGWAPGITPHPLPDGVSWFLPRGSDVVMQVHYHRTGKEEKAKTQLGLYFAKDATDRPLQQIVIPGDFLTIPPGEENFRVKGSIWAADDCTLLSVTPHMHLLGKKIKVTMKPPGGDAVTLIGIDQWEYNWQEMYFLKDPIAVKAGTRFDVEAVYDNSAKNPANPRDPPARVFVGDETTNEMCFAFLGLTKNEAGPIGFRVLGPNGLIIRRPGPLPKPDKP
jgi:peroxiredoxin